MEVQEGGVEGGCKRAEWSVMSRVWESRSMVRLSSCLGGYSE
jgi:hypothetical protein